MGFGFHDYYSLPGLIELLVKIACIVHVIRTGRNLMWIWLILLIPVVGPVVYFIVEILPDLRTGRGMLPTIKIPQNPGRAIARLTEELEFSNTVEKRAQLARAYAAAGRFPEAIETVSACLRGVFKDDPLLTLELAEIQFMAGNHREALESLAELDRLRFKDYRHRRLVIKAQCLEKIGEIDNAKATYDEALEIALGEEARCGYAALLARHGDPDGARRLCEETARNAKHGGGAYRRANREWIARSRELAASLPKP